MVSREGVDGRCAAEFSRVIDVEDEGKGSIAPGAGSQQANRLESTTVLGFNIHEDLALQHKIQAIRRC